MNLETDYGRSKADGERYARELQAGGAPVTSIYPSGVYGPDDPGLGPSNKGLRDRIRFGWFKTTGGLAIVDVRDLARIIASDSGAGPWAPPLHGRRTLPGRGMEEADLCEAITGRNVRRLPGPPPLIRGIGHVVDFIKSVAPYIRLPAHPRGVDLRDSLRAMRQPARPWRIWASSFDRSRETLEDSIRWLLRSRRASGKSSSLASRAPAR